MTVKELIDVLMDCRSDADVVMGLFDNCTSVYKVLGAVNNGNTVQIYEKVAFDSKLARK